MKTSRSSALARLLGFVLIAALVVIPSASAGNVAPNPSFEADCSGIPCNWANTAPIGTLDWDASIAHSGNASLKETSDAFGTPGAESDCIAVSPGTDVTRSVWYRTTSAQVAKIEFNISFYASSDCSDATSIGPGNLETSSPNADGQWHLLQEPSPLMVFQGTTGARSTLFFLCSADCPVGTVVNFDDVILGSGPLAVTVKSLTVAGRGKVIIRWRTGTEADLLGFHVYRSHRHAWRRVNHSLIAAKGSVSGASYRYRDQTAKDGVSYRYRIKAVNLDGTAAWFGPVARI